MVVNVTEHIVFSGFTNIWLPASDTAKSIFFCKAYNNKKKRTPPPPTPTKQGYVFVLSCVCYVLVQVCLIVLCGHLLGKG